MFSVRASQTFRPTRDIDLLGRMDNSIEEIVAAIKDICRQEVQPDGMIYAEDSVTAVRITEGAEYEGVRVRVQSFLGNAQISLQLDIGFGDIVTPPPSLINYPGLLEFPSPQMKGYNRETTIAEKFQAMISIGSVNSRMKDFYDIWYLAVGFSFDGRILAEAIRKTFENRQTEWPSQVVVFQRSFAEDRDKSEQWVAFLKRNNLINAPKSFAEVILTLEEFLLPIMQALSHQRIFRKTWNAPGPWS